MHPAPRHIDGFDLGSTRLADSLIVAVADREIVFHDPAKPTKPQNEHLERAVVIPPDIEDQPPLFNADLQIIRPGIAITEITKRLENIIFDQIENCHTPFLLDIGVAPEYRCLVEFDFDDAVVAHDRVLAGNIFWASLGRLFVHSPVPRSIFADPCKPACAKG